MMIGMVDTNNRSHIRARTARMPPGACRHTRLRGQALILFMVAMLVLGLGVIVLFNTGQTVTKKVQLVNTADAAAYSAAVQEARALNLIAYMNRATVANEVAVAQMVSWYSWTNYTISATDHFNKAILAIRVVLDVLCWGCAEPILGPINRGLRRVARMMKKGRNVEQKVMNLAATAIANLNGAYAMASRVIGVGASTDVAWSIARKVVHENVRDAYIPMAGKGILIRNVAEANHYIDHHIIPDGKNRRGKHPGSRYRAANRFQNVVMEARDPFSRERNGDFLFFKKRGGTDLVGYKNWVGLDTLNFQIDMWLVYKHYKENVPLAWGGGATKDSGRKRKSFRRLARKNKGWRGVFDGKAPDYATKNRYAAYGGALKNGVASSLVLSEPAEGGDPWIKPYGSLPGATLGLPDYSDIANGKATVPYLNGESASANGVDTMDVGPIFTVLVAEKMDTVRTSSHIDGIGGPPDFEAPDKAVRDGLTALSSAQVYFERSRSLMPRLLGADKRELGSLFSPYWQARLVETPCSTRQIVAVSYGAIAPCL